MPKQPVNPVLKCITTVRLSQDEYARLVDAAADQGITYSHLVRSIVLGFDLPGPRPARVDMQTVLELRRIGVNLNQFLALLHRWRPPEMSEENQTTFVASFEAVRAVFNLVSEVAARLQ